MTQAVPHTFPARSATRAALPLPTLHVPSRAAGEARALGAYARSKLADLVRPLHVPDLALEAWFRLHGLRPHHVDLPNGTMHAFVAGGDEPPLLLLQGFGADAKWQWWNQVRELSKHRRLIVPDLLYFGRSRSHSGDVSLDHQLETVLQLLDRYGIARCDVVGISFGGLVAFELASRYGHRVRKVVLSNSPGPVMKHEDHHDLLARFQVREIADILVPEGPDHVPRLFGVAWHRPPYVPRFALPDAYHRFFIPHAEEKRLVMRALTERIESPELEDRKVDVETLILWGEHDAIFPVRLAKRLRERIGSHARLHVIPGTAHAPNQEKAREYNRIVLDFLLEHA